MNSAGSKRKKTKMDNTIIINADNFDTDVLQSNLPVLVDFWAEWCGPCRAIAPVLDEIAREKSGIAKVAKVNIDENSELANRFEIRSIPTLLVFDRGTVHSRLVGVLPKQAILEKVDEVLCQEMHA